VALVGCHDSTRPGGADADPTLVSLAAVCHRRFEIANGNPGALTVRYEVSATGETGELTLSGHSSGASTSATRLVTLTDGDVRLSYRGTRIAEASAAGSACAAPVATAPQPMASVGEWSAPFGWPVVAVHLHLLPDGRVLSWGRIGTPQIWDPATGAFTEAATATDVFCAGHAFLPDGRLLVAGGSHQRLPRTARREHVRSAHQRHADARQLPAHVRRAQRTAVLCRRAAPVEVPGPDRRRWLDAGGRQPVRAP
jgi:hypothetical protein